MQIFRIEIQKYFSSFSIFHYKVYAVKEHVEKLKSCIHFPNNYMLINSWPLLLVFHLRRDDRIMKEIPVKFIDLFRVDSASGGKKWKRPIGGAS